MIFRLTKKINYIHLAAFLILLISLFINTYKLNDLMLFIGDYARDFLAARDMIVNGKIPLVGIPSSVVWLHQGPLSIYGIGAALFVTSFNPLAPAYFYGLIGAFTTLLVFFIGYRFFNARIGMIAGLLYATAPIVIVNARMPYHTSLVPFFSAITLLLLLESIVHRRYYIHLFISLGLLLQVELSNIVILPVVILLYYYFKIKFTLKMILQLSAAFIIGVGPLILYEIKNGPSYILFPLWIGNRIIKVITGNSSESASANVMNIFDTTYQQISGLILPHFAFLSIILFVGALLFLYRLAKKNKKTSASYFVLLSYTTLPLASFFLHSTPGTAYYTLLYPTVILSLGILFDEFIKKFIFVMGIIIIISIFNVFQLLKNEYYAVTDTNQTLMPPTNYNFGSTWKFSDELSRFIVEDAKGKEFQIEGRGSLVQFATGMDTYKYLIWYHGGKLSKNARLKYILYTDKSLIEDESDIVYSSKAGFVIRHD